MNRRAFLATTAAAVTATTGCVGDTTDSNGSAEARIELSDIEHKTTAETMHYLVGEAHNVADEDLEFQVRIDWFDADDTLLGESFTQIRADIEAGQTRAWDSTYYDAEEHGPPDHYDTTIHIY